MRQVNWTTRPYLEHLAYLASSSAWHPLPVSHGGQHHQAVPGGPGEEATLWGFGLEGWVCASGIGLIGLGLVGFGLVGLGFLVIDDD